MGRNNADFSSYHVSEIRNPEEFAKTADKVAKIAERHGKGYTFSPSDYHSPNNGTNSFNMYSPEGKWAGELTHDNTDGNVGHLYVDKEHRLATAALVNHAINYAVANDHVPPNRGSDMTPAAERLYRHQLPQTRSSTNVAVTKPNTNYGDK